MCDVWYRSVYWRIALGFIGFLALMLVAQGALFMWLTAAPARLQTLGIVSGVVLLSGAAVIMTVVFGTGRRRLWALTMASERVDAGDLTARAPEDGSDEVSIVARSFNKMADDLGRRARDLETSDRVRRHLLADITHELMTPLTAIRGYIETLAMPEFQLEQATRERYMANLDEETHRLERIIKDLRDLARLEGGGVSFQVEQIQVAAIFDRLVARHERDTLSIKRLYTIVPGCGDSRSRLPCA